MPKILKDEIYDRLNARGKEMGVDNFADMIADETIGITEDEIPPVPPGKRAPGA